MIHYVDGDASAPVGDDVLICHIVNTASKIGAGFSGDIIRRYPAIKEQYMSSRKPLGHVIWSGPFRNGTLVANMVAMRGVRSQMNPKPIVYGSLQVCLWQVSARAEQSGRVVHMPYIGAGLAGGEWPLIEPIIIETLVNRDLDVYVYRLTPVQESVKHIMAVSR